MQKVFRGIKKALFCAVCIAALLITSYCHPKAPAVLKKWSAEISCYVASDCDHGATLSEVAKGIRNLGYETFAVFDSKGNKLFETTDYAEKQVRVEGIQATALVYADVQVYIHSHPVDVPFSNNDIKSMVQCGVELGVVVGPGSTYVLHIPQGSEMTCEDVDRFFREHMDLLCVISLSEEAVLASSDELVSALADEFGLSYYRYSLESGILERLDAFLAE